VSASRHGLVLMDFLGQLACRFHTSVRLGSTPVFAPIFALLDHGTQHEVWGTDSSPALIHS